MKEVTEFAAEIDSKFPSTEQSIFSDFNAGPVLKNIKEYFDQQCTKDATLDPRPQNTNDNERAIIACRLYRHAAFKFVERDRVLAAEDLLLHGWDKFNAIQKESGRKIYKAIIAFGLVQLHEEVRKDVGAATYWSMLTHADDALVNHMTGLGMERLLYSFGMSEQALAQFNGIIEQNRHETRTRGWSLPNKFADDMVLRFALSKPQYAHIFANPTTVLEFPPTYPYLGALLERANDSKLKGKKKGDAFENLASYLFMLIPGLALQRKVIPETKDAEHDLVVSNLRSTSNFEAEMFGRDFLVECKNWESKVGVSEVGYFLYRMRLTHTKVGVIFAKSGISEGANEEPVYAKYLLQRAFHEDGSICIVIKGEDIEKILSRQTSFRSLLVEKANHLRFGIRNTKLT